MRQMTTSEDNKNTQMNDSVNKDSVIQACFNLEYPTKQNNKQKNMQESRFSLDVDLTIPNHGITAIFGQSGSGKTSLLRCIAGLEKAQKGHLIVNGNVWQNDSQYLPTHKRPISYVFQEPSLFDHLIVRENIAYAMKRSDKAFSQSLFEQVVQMLDIESILLNKTQTLSGGERQRVAIARAILAQPDLLLMDEPLASLDDNRKQEILPYLETLRTTFDTPILYVSHSMEEVARLADHVVLLEQGKVAAQGDLQTVFSRLDLPVRLGKETGVVIHGKVTDIDSQWHLATVLLNAKGNGGSLFIPDNQYVQGQDIRVRILAKDISLALKPNDDSSILNRLSATVMEITDDQDSAMALIRLDLGSNYLIARLTRKSVHQLQIQKGDQVWAQIKSVAVVP